jgi:hypothetical protein
VKIDNLAIFSAHVKHKGGWNDITQVDLSIGEKTSKIYGIKMCAQATGDFTRAELSKYGTLELNREWRKKVQEAKEEAAQPIGG